MKFIHTADVHLGVNPDAGKALSENRPNEIWDSFARMIKRCEEEQLDLLLIAGDLFHRQPLLRELKEVNYLFSKLTKTRVVLIAGNHDYVKPDSYYLTFPWNENVFPLLSDSMEWIEFPEIQTCIYGFSYHRREITESLYDEARPGQRQPYEILLAHGGDERHIPIRKQKLKALGYDYIALGHIHKPQKLNDSAIRYAGAPEPIDKNDIGPHGYIVGEISAAGTRTKFVKSAVREYIHLIVEVEEAMTGFALREKIRSAIEDNGRQNIYKVILKGLRDPEVLFDPDSMDTYGNILEIIDETRPAYDFEKLEAENRDNLLGKFIGRMKGYDPGTIESFALYEGVRAILKAKRG